MRVQPGDRLGAYQITSSLGSGGMGEVWRAHDTRLGRDVALKVLPPEFAADPDRLARFRREAKILAALSHPNIAAIYGLEDINGVTALALELVDGLTLADRIAQGRIPLDKSLEIGRQIAEALEAAHAQGIVHRDLKPANVMLTRAGVKLLDFGLARHIDGDSGEVSATRSLPLTQSGIIVGTPAYMAPEQLEGRPADRRADIFAFGCLMFEMVSGRRAFDGVTRSSVPSLLALPSIAGDPGVLRRLDQVISACLTTSADDRIRDTHDLCLQLKWIAAETGSRPATVSRSRVAFAAGVAAVIIAAAVVAQWVRPRSAPSVQPDKSVLSLVLPPGVRFGPLSSPVISPDGRRVVFSATGSGFVGLWVRELNGLEARPLPAAERGISPFWSPDSRSVGFFTVPGKLKQIDISSGTVVTVCDVVRLFGASWNSRGQILFSSSDSGGLYVVPAVGGTPIEVTKPDPSVGEMSHRQPSFLPDGNHFLYLAWGSPDKAAIYVGQLDSPTRHKLFSAVSKAEYADGHLFYLRNRVLMAQPFDPATLTLGSQATAVADRIDRAIPLSLAGIYSVSQNGTVVYSSDGIVPSQLAFVDRAGRVQRTIGEPATLWSFALSPSGDSIALVQPDDETGVLDVWLRDVRSGTDRRITTQARAREVVFSPDGRRLAYSADRTGHLQVYIQDRETTAAPAPLNPVPFPQTVRDWTASPELLVEQITTTTTGDDLWVVPPDNPARAAPILQTAANEIWGHVSRDGRWLAYQSNEGRGVAQVFLTSFPVPGRRLQISKEGGGTPFWSQHGLELFFVGPQNWLTAVKVHGGPLPEVDPLEWLFNDPDMEDFAAADGNQILAAKQMGTVRQAFTVISNWRSVVRQEPR